jgi:nucleotide-binding universal stress UspA family protein
MPEVSDPVRSSKSSPTPPPGVWRSGLISVLLPTDFSPRAERALDYAIELARRLGAKLTLLHVAPEASILDYTMEGGATAGSSGMAQESARETGATIGAYIRAGLS